MDFKKVGEYLEKITNDYVPGNSIRIYLKGKEVYRGSSGYSDVENKKKVNGDELLFMYSCTKMLTCVAALSYWEEGKFGLEDPLSDYIPEFRHMQILSGEGKSRVLFPCSEQIRIKHLFTHTSGFDYGYKDNPYFLEAVRENKDTRGVVASLAKAPLLFKPGSRWCYGFSHDILAAVMEVVSGKPFGQIIREKIFEPLNMNCSYIGMSSEVDKDKIAPLYKHDFISGKYHRIKTENEFFFNDKFESGGAGLISTPGDMGKFVSAMSMWAKTPDGKALIGNRAFAELRSNRLNGICAEDFLKWSQFKGYGYGLGVRTFVDKTADDNPFPLGEFGWGGAAGSQTIIDPESGIAMFYAQHTLINIEYFTTPMFRKLIWEAIFS